VRRFLEAVGVSAVLLGIAAPACAQTAPFTVSFVDTHYTIAETPGKAVVKLKRSNTSLGPSGLSARVTVRSTEMPSGKVLDYNVGWERGETEAGLNLDNNDVYYNPGRSCTLQIVSIDSGGTIVSPDTATVTIIDDEQPPTVSVQDILVNEGDPQPNGPASTIAQFTVTLTSGLLQDVTSIPYVVHEGTAKEWSDYQPAAGTVGFFKGVLTAKLNVAVVRDREPEGDETFTLELFPPAPITATKAIATCTIHDDDNAISPLQLKILKGTKGTIHIDLVKPVALPEQVTLRPSDASLVSVPAAVTIPAGSSSMNVDVVGTNIGTGTIAATLAPSRGNRTTFIDFTVYEPVNVTLDPQAVNLLPGGTTNVTVRITPPPPTSIMVFLQPAKGGVADVPPAINLGPDGKADFSVRALDVGSVGVSVFTPDTYGGSSATLLVSVTQPVGVFVTRVSPTTGRTAGGEAVTIFGDNFNGPCVPSFSGVPAESVEAQNAGSISVTTPPHDAGFVDIAVRCGKSFYAASKAFTYVQTHLQAVSVSPAAGTVAGGTIVRMTGVDLHADSCSARFGETMGQVIATNGRKDITVVTPPHTAGVVQLSLMCGNETAAVPGGFNYVSGDPQAAVDNTYFYRWQQGQPGNLYGYPFRADDLVLINAVPVEDLTTPSASAHYFTVPDITGDVQVTLRDYTGRTSTKSLTIYAVQIPPKVSSIPNQVTLGAEFSISGASIGSGFTYTLGPALLQPVVRTDSSAIFRAPLSLGVGSFSFTALNHGSVIATQTVNLVSSGLAVSAVSASSPCAAMDEGALVTVSGSGFDEGASVRFGKTFSTDVVVKDGFTLIARLPPPFGNTQPQITVFNPDGTSATLTNAFSYKSAPQGCGGGRRRAVEH
jgi:hypothetical protein